jgi:hypothetical protein
MCICRFKLLNFILATKNRQTDYPDLAVEEARSAARIRQHNTPDQGSGRQQQPAFCQALLKS